jgi:hypothetical protein
MRLNGFLTHIYILQELRLTQEPEPGRYWAISGRKGERMVKGKKEVLVSFLFYPASYDMWLKESEIVSSSHVDK